MSGLGCPFGAGPACGDCTGSCWDAPAPAPAPPGPCEGCYYVSGAMQECTGLCEGLTAENVEERRLAFEVSGRH